MLLIVGAIGFIPVSMLWTQAKRSDKPWTAFRIQREPKKVQLTAPKNAVDAQLPSGSGGSHSVVIDTPAQPLPRPVNPQPRPQLLKPIPTPSEAALSAEIVNPADPAIVIENTSDIVAEGIHWELVMFRTTDRAFCSYATQTISWLREGALH